jgi:hypothetical protein
MYQICTSIFDDSSKEQFMSHPNYMGHTKKVECVCEGDIVLSYNLSDKTIFAISILRNLQKGKIYTDNTSLYDKKLYEGDYAHYSKYEIGVKTYFIEPIQISDICKYCNIPADTKIITCYNDSFRRINQRVNISPWINDILAKKLIAEHI